MERRYTIEKASPSFGDMILPLLGTVVFLIIFWPLAFQTLIYSDSEFKSSGAIAFGLLFLSATIAIMYSWVSGLFGTEQFIISHDALTYKSGPWGWGLGRKYRKEKIKLIELVIETDYPTLKDGKIIQGSSRIVLGIRLKWRLIELGKNLTKKSGEQILAALNEFGYIVKLSA